MKQRYGDDLAGRKPRPLLEVNGPIPPRYAERQDLAKSSQPPPRTTQAPEPGLLHTGSFFFASGFE